MSYGEEDKGLLALVNHTLVTESHRYPPGTRISFHHGVSVDDYAAALDRNDAHVREKTQNLIAKHPDMVGGTDEPTHQYGITTHQGNGAFAGYYMTHYTNPTSDQTKNVMTRLSDGRERMLGKIRRIDKRDGTHEYRVGLVGRYVTNGQEYATVPVKDELEGFKVAILNHLDEK